jgi:hypothetical protein
VPTPSLPGLQRYASELAELLGGQHDDARSADVSAALDGEVSRRLRACVPLSERRRDGAFFTSRRLADQLLDGDVDLLTASEVVADAACGAGDLLLSAARSLPIRGGVTDTLKLWGRCLIGRDLNPAYVRTTRLRLAVLASARIGRSWACDEEALARLLPGIAVGDGTQLRLSDRRAIMLLNPPYGATIATEPWGTGRIARAAVFTARVVDHLPDGAALRAVLPDVLRSGSNYQHWREYIERQLDVESVEPVGQFDASCSEAK